MALKFLPASCPTPTLRRTRSPSGAPQSPGHSLHPVLRTSERPCWRHTSRTIGFLHGCFSTTKPTRSWFRADPSESQGRGRKEAAPRSQRSLRTGAELSTPTPQAGGCPFAPSLADAQGVTPQGTAERGPSCPILRGWGSAPSLFFRAFPQFSLAALLPWEPAESSRASLSRALWVGHQPRPHRGVATVPSRWEGFISPSCCRGHWAPVSAAGVGVRAGRGRRLARGCQSGRSWGVALAWPALPRGQFLLQTAPGRTVGAAAASSLGNWKEDGKCPPAVPFTTPPQFTK